MALADLSTLDHRARLVCPKPSRVADRILYKRTREAKARAFRAAVWARDQGRCVYCQRLVVKSLGWAPNRGEVHHLRGRRVAPEDRYNPDQAVLLCAIDHEKAQRHEITIARPR